MRLGYAAGIARLFAYFRNYANKVREPALLCEKIARIMMHLLDTRDASAERAAAFLKTVAHPGRLRIVCALMEGECAASALAAHARLPAPSLSQQAAVLEAEGIIAQRRVGRSVLYRLLSPEAKALAQFLYRMFCKQSGQPKRSARLNRASTSRKGKS